NLTSHVEADQLAEKLNHQPQSHQPAGKVRRKPAWIAHDLQGGDPRVNRVKSRLVIRLPVVAERIVHVDEYFAIFAGVRPFETDAAGEILRNVRAAILFVREPEQV